MTRRGFALVAVLWLLAAVGGLVATALVSLRMGLGASANRIRLERAAWAREACLDILQARFHALGPLPRLDTVDLGRAAWCTVTATDPGSRLNLNRADAATLRLVLGNDSLVEALLDWRDPDDVPRPLGAEADWYRREHRVRPRNGPLASVAELRRIRGFDGERAGQAAAVLGVEGDGLVDLLTAPPAVLAVLPGFPGEIAERVLRQRAAGQPVASLDELAARVSPTSRAVLAAHYQELLSLVRFRPAQLTVHATGGIRGTPITASATLVAVPLADRLAIVRREPW